MPLSATMDSELKVAPVGIRDVLTRLGFTTYHAEFTDEQPGYEFDFGDIVLRAYQLTNLYMRPVMQFSGFSISADKHRITDISFEMLMQVESYEQGVAFLAYNLDWDFTLSQPKWLEQGREWKDLLPWRKKAILYGLRPHCHVDADYFRVAAKRLIAESDKSDEFQTFEVSCADGILRFKMKSQTVALPVMGSDWPSAYIGKVKQLERISKRTPSQGVPIGVWEGRLAIGGRTIELIDEIQCGVDAQAIVN